VYSLCANFRLLFETQALQAISVPATIYIFNASTWFAAQHPNTNIIYMVISGHCLQLLH
jgi:hypothetical protein